MFAALKTLIGIECLLFWGERKVRGSDKKIAEHEQYIMRPWRRTVFLNETGRVV